MVKEGWKMKVDQSVDFSTLTLLPKVTIMTVDFFIGKVYLLLNRQEGHHQKGHFRKESNRCSK